MYDLAVISFSYFIYSSPGWGLGGWGLRGKLSCMLVLSIRDKKQPLVYPEVRLKGRGTNDSYINTTRYYGPQKKKPKKTRHEKRWVVSFKFAIPLKTPKSVEIINFCNFKIA